MKIKDLDKYSNIKELAKAMGIYTSVSIFGPLVVIGGVGYFLDRHFGTKPVIMIISILIAFVISNILLFKKTIALIKHIDKVGHEATIKREGEEKQQEENRNI